MADQIDAITELLRESRAGSPDALDRLMPLIYDDLRGIAHRQLQRERPNHTLGTTALVHETYLRLVDQRRVDWQDRAHFFALAARSMRRILVDYARRRSAKKRDAKLERISFDDVIGAADQQAELIIMLDEALTRLAQVDERQCWVVEYRYFAGFTEEETAELLDVTSRTVRRDWAKAKSWLYEQLADEG